MVHIETVGYFEAVSAALDPAQPTLVNRRLSQPSSGFNSAIFIPTTAPRLPVSCTLPTIRQLAWSHAVARPLEACVISIWFNNADSL